MFGRHFEMVKIKFKITLKHVLNHSKSINIWSTLVNMIFIPSKLILND